MSTVRLSKEIQDRVRQVAEAKDCTISEVHRQALEEYCRRELPEGRIDRWAYVIGTAEGVDLPPDASARAAELFGQVVDEKYGRNAR